MTPPDQKVCYRHPDRPTGLSCTECERPICGACSVEASVGQRCPECARGSGTTKVVDGRRASAGALAGVGPMTRAIMAVTIAVAALEFLSPSAYGDVFEQLALVNGFVTELGEWWRMLTVVLLHGSLTHILFNMWALYVLGPQVEREVGPSAFLALYVGSAAAGSSLAILLGNPQDVSVGASGAIFGLFGVWMASAVRRRNTRAGRAVLNQLGALLLINAVIPFIIPRVSWQGHLGGLIGGFLIGWAWARLRGPNAALLRATSALLVGVASILSVFV